MADAEAKVVVMDMKLTEARPVRNLVENPITWWGDTPFFMWNWDYGGYLGLWAGAGEAEALGELFFDNLATLLSVTDLMLGFFLNVLIAGEAAKIDQGYADAIVATYTRFYFQRCIPGVAFGLMFGNLYYGHMAGRLAYKEKRSDVTAQPYGLNTTGAFITLGAVNLTALFAEVYKEKNLEKGANGDWTGAGNDAAENAWKIAVSANFLTGVMECAGCFLGDPIRKLIPSPAYYSLITGVGFTFLGFAPMIKISAEPILCFVPLLIVLCGFFGHGKYKIGNTGLSVPVALVAILVSCIIGWLGGCRHKNDSVEMYNYGSSYSEINGGNGNSGTKSMYYSSGKYATCTGTSEHDLKYAYSTYAGELGAFGDGIFTGLSHLTWHQMKNYFGIIIVVGVVGFGATLACVESASAAGDDYMMTETMMVDGVGTMIGACFGSFYGTTVYIGHPIHKGFGARRGYSIINGFLYFILLVSGLFASLYQAIPGCANGALLIFVGLIICRQALEDNPPRYYPAIFFGLFASIANWAKLYVDPGISWKEGAGWWDSGDAGNWGSTGVGIEMMGQGGGEWYTLFMTSIFCYCIDRAFLKGAACCAIAAILQAFTGIPTMFNAGTESGRMGPEKAGFYPKKAKDTNFSWAWATAFAMGCGFFLIQFALQRSGVIDPPITEEFVKRLPGKPEKAVVEDDKGFDDVTAGSA